jgi:hypothetical protein
VSNGLKINLEIDAVVILTTSNWFTELRHNRNHYATCFSKMYPVIFIQPDLTEQDYYYEETSIDNLIILHVYENYNSQVQVDLISTALNSKGIITPLLWIYNPQFIHFIQRVYSPYKIYHATNHYFAKDHLTSFYTDDLFIKSLYKVLDLVDQVVCVSEGIREAILQANCKLEKKLKTITNSCDYAVYKKDRTTINLNDSSRDVGNIASKQSYDNKFIDLIEHINTSINDTEVFFRKLKILVLYEGKSIVIGAIKDHVESFRKFSEHYITYIDATKTHKSIDLSKFDTVVIHYSLRLSVNTGDLTVSPEISNSLKSYAGLKIAFLQDEYEATNTAIERLRDLGIQIVFTCVPDEFIDQVYSPALLPHVKFFNNLTGYVPASLIDYPVKPISARTTYIAYRGRNLPYWYGSLGQEKEHIGRVVKEFCIQKGIPEDIEWDANKRIYGPSWHEFLSSSKATLGTESGSTIFDYDGELSRKIKDYLIGNPHATYDEIHELFLSAHEGHVKMNQISPKIFEAICFHTALILFEGSYSGVLIPERHYIPLKKDYSNLDDVIEKVKNDEYLTTMANLAYREIVLSGNYSYGSFVAYFDSVVNLFLRKKYGDERLFIVEGLEPEEVVREGFVNGGLADDGLVELKLPYNLVTIKRSYKTKFKYIVKSCLKKLLLGRFLFPIRFIIARNFTPLKGLLAHIKCRLSD